MICPMCNKEPEPIIINTSPLALAEYMTYKEQADEEGICVHCVIALVELD